jgi:hypothetical protein
MHFEGLSFMGDLLQDWLKARLIISFNYLVGEMWKRRCPDTYQATFLFQFLPDGLYLGFKGLIEQTCNAVHIISETYPGHEGEAALSVSHPLGDKGSRARGRRVYPPQPGP